MARKIQEHKNNNCQGKERYNSPLNLFISGKIELHVPVKKSREQIWNNLYNHVKDSKRNEINDAFKINLSLKIQLSAAASILMLIGVFFFFNLSKSIIYQTQLSEISEITLPDQSEVILNADSRLVYKKNILNGSREVYLQGEAIFKVTKGKLFTIATDEGNVNVLGTSFNVYSRENNFKVSCFTGKVLVRSLSNNQNTILTPNKETRINHNRELLKPYKFNSNQAGKWPEGEFYFNNANIESVFGEIERQFSVKIQREDVDLRHYTGSFNNLNLEQALDLVCIPMDLDYSFNDSNNIIIKNNK